MTYWVPVQSRRVFIRES